MSYFDRSPYEPHSCDHPVCRRCNGIGLTSGVDLTLREHQRREAACSGQLARRRLEASRLDRRDPPRVIGSLAELSIRLSKRHRDESIAEICRRIDRGER